MSSKFSIFTAILLALSSTSCVYGTIDNISVCIPPQHVDVPGGLYSNSYTGTITYDIATYIQEAVSIVGPNLRIASIKFDSVSIKAVGGIESVDFLEVVNATFSNHSRPLLPAVTLINYIKNPSVSPVPNPLVINSATDVNLKDYVMVGAVSATFNIVGNPPADPWAAEISVCLTVNLNVDVNLTTLGSQNSSTPANSTTPSNSTTP